VRQRDRARQTIKLLEDTVNGTRAAAAAHGDVELVGVCVGHFGCISKSSLRFGIDSKGSKKVADGWRIVGRDGANGGVD
jgi:hypothetical protein